MIKVILTAAVVLAASSFASGIVIDFETPATGSSLDQFAYLDVNNGFGIRAGSGVNTTNVLWSKASPTVLAVYSPGSTYQLPNAGNGWNGSWNAGATYMSAPGDTISCDIDLRYNGVAASGSQDTTGLLLQEKSGSESYRAYLTTNNATGAISLVAGCVDYYASPATGHTWSAATPVGTFDNSGPARDLGWYHMDAVTSVDNGVNYKVVVTVKNLQTNTVTSLTYIDTGTAKYLTPQPVGLFASHGYGEVGVWDNFSITAGSAGDATPPTTVTDLAAGNPTLSSITLTWTAPSDPESGCTAYDIRYSTSTITDANFADATAAPGVPAPVAPGTNQSVTVTGLSVNTMYYFAMKTCNGAGNWSAISNVPSLSIVTDTTPPAAVTLTAGDLTTTGLTLSWVDSGDDGMTDQAAGYEIRYSTSMIDETNWSEATPVAGLPAIGAPGSLHTITLSALIPSTTYYFAARYRDEGPNWSAINVLTVATLDPDLTAPTAVTDLRVLSTQSDTVSLAWTAPTDYGADGAGPFPAAGYDLRYSIAPISDDASFAAAARVTAMPAPAAPGAAETFNVTGLTPAATYYFAIKSFDAAQSPNVSALSNIVTGTTSPPQAVPLTVSGAPRPMNTLEQSYPAYPVMNPVANGGAGSYRWDLSSNPGNHFGIDPAYGTVWPNAPLAAGDYPITVRVTDLNNATATLSVTVSVLTTPMVMLTTDTIFDNYGGGSWLAPMYILAEGFSNNRNVTTWTLDDSSGYFAIDSGYNVLYLTKGTPPVGDYPIRISLTQNGQPLGPFDFTIHVFPAQKITYINFAQITVSTSEMAGCVVGTASATVWEPGYRWTIPICGSDGGTFTIPDPSTGVVTLAKTPAPGYRNITIMVQDALNSYSQNIIVHVVEGTTLPAGNMSMTVAANLDNYTSSGSVGTPTVTGIPGTRSWSCTGDGVGYRYAINSTTGTITIIGCLSYNPTIDGVDYSDVITVTCTDGINTCTNSFKIPVAACVGPVLNVGPGQQFAHLNDALFYCAINGWGRPFAGVTFNVYPSDDPNYYLSDGQGYPTKGWFPVPMTIQGAPGQRFPTFRGGDLYYGKGFFMSYSYDLWIKNVEIRNVTSGSNVSGNDNLTGVCKESGCTTGNVFLDNFYIHDCQEGIARGAHGCKWFITNGRVSHCGVGTPGQTHNIYLLGDFVYINNVLSDQSSIGHTFKSRCVKNIIKNCRFYDGELGHGSIVVDLPEGGVDTIANTVIQKGPNWQNEFALHFADAGDNWSIHAANSLGVSGCWFFTDVWQPDRVTAAVDYSLAAADNLPASMTMTGNSFYGFVSSNFLRTAANPSGAVGATSITGTSILTAQPPLDWSFPGPGPDPTIDSPPGPFLAPYGVVGGPQITLPVNEIRVDATGPVGSPVVQPTWLPGNSGATSPIWSLRKNPGDRYAIDPATGAITTAALLLPGSVDVLEIDVAQPPICFSQWYGGQTYYDHPTDGSFIHSIYVVVSGDLPPIYAITASAGAGGGINPGGVVAVNFGGSQTYTITANRGYVIDSLLVDGTPVGAASTYTFSNVTANHTIGVTFAASPGMTITASAGVGGTVIPSGNVIVEAGTSQTFTLAAYTAHTIADVLVDGVSVGPVSTYTFDGVSTNHTISVTFSAMGDGLSPVLVNFETPGQENLFVSSGNLLTRMAGHGGYMVRAVGGNGIMYNAYSPGGAAYLMGAGTISADVDLIYGGATGTNYRGGLMLQQRSGSETYLAYLNADSGTPTLNIGCFDWWGTSVAGHTGPAIVSLTNETYSPDAGTVDLGWYHLTAVVSIDGVGHYRVDATAVSPSGHTYTASYLDTGPSQYITSCPVGLYNSSAWSASIYFDNLQIIPDANQPKTPQLGLVTCSTVQIVSLGAENDATTDHLVQEVTTKLYIGPNGRLQSTPFWQPRQAWSNTVVWGLSSTTSYQFASKARNSSGIASSYSLPAMVTTTMAGDIDGDSQVNLADLKLMIAAWNSEGGGAFANWNPDADPDGDNFVNLSDLKILVAHWNS